MRVLVCGGRDYDDWNVISGALQALHRKHGITVLIHGRARGTDTTAGYWAMVNGIEVKAFPADWATHGWAAGPIRNQQMLDEGCPDCVVAFPGGSGTADMVARARKAGITKIWIVER